jgi:hypothetical protein
MISVLFKTPESATVGLLYEVHDDSYHESSDEDDDGDLYIFVIE